MSFGGSPSCPVCGKAVYHMEQVIGPGRRVYHKLCLKCQSCQKRLDQGSVVEHDLLPYCARCHTQQFGTRDLRHANHLPTSSSPLRSPMSTSTSNSLSTSSISLPSTPVPRRPPPSTEFYIPPHIESPSIPRDAPTTPSDPSTPITRPDFRSSRPISVPYAGGSKALDERGLLKRGESPRSKVGEKLGVGKGEDECGGCGKRVYAAEQVFAIGQKWHKVCLRCSTCKTTLDPGRVSDREGQVYCKNCYAKDFGPGGIMGKR